MSRFRQSAALAARNLGVLPAIEQLRFLKSFAANWRANARFRKSQPDYVFPPLWLAYDAYNNLRFENIYAEGLDAATRIAEKIVTHVPKETPLNILEWGCGPGRVIQHVGKLLGSRAKLFGTDYNEASIRWCLAAMPDISFAMNGLAPPLPFEGASMDAIYNISVFTHLSEEMHYAWISELHRVLKPGGVLLITVHGNKSSHVLTSPERALYDAGNLVVRAKVKEGSRLYAAFQPDQFVRERLLSAFTVLEKVEPFAPMMNQTLWVARKSG